MRVRNTKIDAMYKKDGIDVPFRCAVQCQHWGDTIVLLLSVGSDRTKLAILLDKGDSIVDKYYDVRELIADTLGVEPRHVKFQLEGSL